MSSLEYAVILFAVVALCVGVAGIIVTLILSTEKRTSFDDAEIEREAKELLKNINKPVRKVRAGVIKESKYE